MEYGYDAFSTELPDDIFELLLELGNKIGIDPSASVESENYFCELLENYCGNKNEITQYFCFHNSFPAIHKNSFRLQHLQKGQFLFL